MRITSGIKDFFSKEVDLDDEVAESEPSPEPIQQNKVGFIVIFIFLFSFLLSNIGVYVFVENLKWITYEDLLMLHFGALMSLYSIISVFLAVLLVSLLYILVYKEKIDSFVRHKVAQFYIAAQISFNIVGMMIYGAILDEWMVFLIRSLFFYPIVYITIYIVLGIIPFHKK